MQHHRAVLLAASCESIDSRPSDRHWRIGNGRALAWAGYTQAARTRSLASRPWRARSVIKRKWKFSGWGNLFFSCFMYRRVSRLIGFFFVFLLGECVERFWGARCVVVVSVGALMILSWKVKWWNVLFCEAILNYKYRFCRDVIN